MENLNRGGTWAVKSGTLNLEVKRGTEDLEWSSSNDDGGIYWEMGAWMRHLMRGTPGRWSCKDPGPREREMYDGTGGLDSGSAGALLK